MKENAEITRLRALPLCFGILMAAIFAWITPWSNVVRQNSPLGGSHFPVASLGFLLVTSILWNKILCKFLPRCRLYAEELLYLWLSVTVSVTLSYTGFARTFLLNISWHPEGLKKDLISGRLIFANDQMSKSILYGVQGGERMSLTELVAVIPWNDWLPTLLVWMSFMISVVIVLVGLASVFAHQWTENEKMSLPLFYIPKVFSEEAERSSLIGSMKNAFFITGLMVPMLIHTVNGLSTYIPNIPQIPTLFLAQPYIPQEGILKGFAKLKIYIYPAFIGFAYLVPRQISISVWFFFLLSFLIPGILSLFGVSIPDIALGTTFGPGAARVEEMQMVGAYGVCALFIIWLAKDHLRSIIFDPSYLPRDVPYSGLIRPRAGLTFFVIGCVLTTVWLVSFGVDLAVAVPFIAVCFMLQIVVAKMICQGGLPYFTLPVAPSDGFLAFTPTHILSSVSIYVGAMVQKVTFIDVRETLIPTLIHASSMTKNLISERKRFLIGIVTTIFVSLIVSLLCMLIIYYRYGALSLPDTWAIETIATTHDRAYSLINHPESPKFRVFIYVFIGALVMVMLIWGYHRFIWWPFHPMGYLMMYNSATHIIWFSFFAGWLCNRLVFHYGGLKTYTSVKWFFIGLIVGDVIMALLWIVTGCFAQVTYHVFPS